MTEINKMERRNKILIGVILQMLVGITNVSGDNKC